MANAVLDPAPNRDDLRASSWGRWFNQLYTVVQNIFSGATFTNPTLAGTVTIPGDTLTVGTGFTTYTPTVSASGSMTVSGVTVNLAQYLRVGPMALVQYDIAYTLGGTASNNVYFSLPWTPQGSFGVLLSSEISMGGAWQGGTAFTNVPSAQLGITPHFGLWTLGAARALVSGWIRLS